MKRTLGIIALALATVSCGGNGSSNETTAPLATTPPAPSGSEPVADGTYGSVQAMMKDVESTFYLCTAPIKIYDPPVSDDALAEADCSSDVTFLIYEPDDVQPNAAVLQTEATGVSVLLVGTNWIINCSGDQAACERIQGGTGGELVVSTS